MGLQKINKDIFIKRYFDNLESLRDIAKDYKIPNSSLAYKAKKVWKLELRTKAESAIIAYKKGKKDNSGINNGRFIDDGIDAKTRFKLKQYNLLPEEYLKLKKEQNYKCKICFKSEEENGKALAIDHCHKTSKVRGLLCDNCNRGIGHLQDDINILESAIKYLKE